MQSSYDDCVFWLLKLQTQNIAAVIGPHRESVRILVNAFQSIVSKDLIKTDNRMISGEGTIVKINECQMARRKYYKGHRGNCGYLMESKEAKKDEFL